MANLSNINGKFVVDTAGNIGVGTLIPRSDANTTNISIQSSGTARLFVNNTGASGKEYAIYSSANGDFGIFDYGAVSARLVINSAGNTTFAGDVSLSTANTDTILTIANTATGGSTWKIHSASGSSPYAQSSGDFLIRNASTNVLRLGINNVATFAGQVHIDSKPNSGLAYNVLIDVGSGGDGTIGYQTPTQLVDNLTGGFNGITFADGTEQLNTTAGCVIATPSRGASADPEDYQRSFSTEFKGKIASGSPGTGSSWIGLVSMSPYKPQTSGFYTTQLGFGADGSNGDMFIRRGTTTSWGDWRKFIISDSSGNTTFTGNVTVGNNGNINIPTASSGNANLNFDGTDFKITSNSSSANLKLETSSTTRLTINSIGRAYFAESVHLIDDKALNFGTSNAFNLRWSTAAASGQGASIIDSNRIFIETNFFQLNSRTGESMIIATGNGDVGLYYNNSQKLKTTSTGVNIIGDTSSDKPVIKISAGANGFTLGKTNQAADYAHFKPLSNSPSVFRIMANTGPNYSYMELWGTDFEANQQNYNRFMFYIDGSTGNGYIKLNKAGNSPTGNLYIGTASNENTLTILNNGRVGIGNTSPQAALDISSSYSIQGGVYTYYYTGSAAGTTNINLDITVNDEGGGGNVFKIEAGFAHYHAMNYNAIGEWWCTSRGTTVVNTYILNAGTTLGGTWSASKPTTSVLRITKSAGTYGGSGKYWVKVTYRPY